MSTVNIRELSRNTKSVLEAVVRSGEPAIITVNGRPQAAVTPLVGAVEAAEAHVLRNAPTHIQEAIRAGEADLISGRASVIDESEFAEGEVSQEPKEVLATVEDQLDSGPLEDAIRAAPKAPEPIQVVRMALAQADVLTIGNPAGDAPGGGDGTYLVHYEPEDDGDEGRVMLPVFTRLEYLRSALLGNEEWQSLQILMIDGGELMKNVDPDTAIVINPGSDLKFELPALDRGTLVAERPVVAAAELVASDS